MTWAKSARSSTAGAVLGTLATISFLLCGQPLNAQTPAPESAATSPSVQLVRPSGPGGAAAPATITLADALERARQNYADYLSAVSDARSAHDDRIQARAALLPSATTTAQELLTTGGLLPTSRYVTNDGVHVYRGWGVFRQDLSPGTFMMTGYKRASAAEAVAKAKQEIASRGLFVTITKAYYDLAVAQRKYATAQQALDQTKRFFSITKSQEQAGEAAHSDVIKAQLQVEQQQQAFDQAQLAMENARLALAVLIFPTLNENFTVVDDLDKAPALPSFSDAQTMVARSNPGLKVAMESLREANFDVSAARNSLLPSITIETDLGIEANAFAFTSRASVDPHAGCPDKPTPASCGRLPNFGQFTTATLSVPVFDWGSLRSKLHQAELKRQQARTELSQTQRELLSNLYSYYNGAAVAQAAVESLRRSADLAAESLRLNTLRYQSGEATVLEVTDAQTALTTARNAYDDGQEAYRVAITTLQTLTGSF
jgi:outer membrane protein TolC